REGQVERQLGDRGARERRGLDQVHVLGGDVGRRVHRQGAQGRGQRRGEVQSRETVGEEARERQRGGERAGRPAQRVVRVGDRCRALGADERDTRDGVAAGAPVRQVDIAERGERERRL